MPVRISLGRPRFIAEASEWPYVKELAPLGLLKIDDRAEFIARYHDRLSRIGLGVIRAALEKVWQHQSEGSWRATPLDERLPIALLCFEDVSKPDDWCHRSFFAAWWLEQTDELLDERNTADDLPTL